MFSFCDIYNLKFNMFIYHGAQDAVLILYWKILRPKSWLWEKAVKGLDDS